MLREARIVMPWYASKHSDAVHDKLQQQLCEAFGGFTAINNAFGGWRSPDGKVVKDVNIVYDVAIDSGRDSPTDLIARFAVEAGRALDQDSVYVRYPNGVVDIIKIDTKADRLAEALSNHEREGAERFLHALLWGNGIIVADMGDGRSAVEPEAAPGTDEDVKLAPGQLWVTRGGGRAAVGRRATIFGGGFYVTLVDNQPPKHRVGFEYAVNMDGQLVGPSHETTLDLVAHLH